MSSVNGIYFKVLFTNFLTVVTSAAWPLTHSDR